MSNANYRAPKAIVFDFGRVLVDFDFGLAFETWARFAGVSGEGLSRAILEDGPYRAHERGELSWERYADHLREMLLLQVSDTELLTGWNSIFKDEVPGMRETLRELARGFPIYLLSNTNRAHYEYWSTRYASLLSPISNFFCSHELGARKPELDVYHLLIDEISINAEHILFFDDVPENVVAARKAGIDSRLFRSVADIDIELFRRP